MEARAVVLGAGFAGAATAYHLVRRGIREVAVLERERTPGVHSSGRNAAMVRQVVSDPAVARLARAGAAAIRSLSRAAGGTVGFEARGSLLLASGERAASLRREAELARAAGLAVESWTPAEALARVPVLEGARIDLACFCPADGVVDIAALLEAYLGGAREGGARLILGVDRVEVLTEGGRVSGVRAGELTIRTPAVVNAAGAWAPGVAASVGALPIRLRAFRRHLMFTGPLPRARADWPFVWDVAHDVYFRPESGGLLLSPCDESELPPGIPDVDPAAIDLLHQKLSHHLPALADVPLARTWAGLRTFAPDKRFVIGPDPLLPGFFWAAGLGGHGVTTSHAAGALAAELVERPESDAGNPFSPARFGAARRD